MSYRVSEYTETKTRTSSQPVCDVCGEDWDAVDTCDVCGKDFCFDTRDPGFYPRSKCGLTIERPEDPDYPSPGPIITFKICTVCRSARPDLNQVIEQLLETEERHKEMLGRIVEIIATIKERKENPNE